MVLIFWQGIISIHQKTFLEEVAKLPAVDKVILAVEHDITPYRKSMGWDVPEINGVEILITPSKEKIHQLFHDHKDAVHVMGGIRIGRMLTIAFEEGVRRKSIMGIMNEPYNDASFKGYLRTLKYKYYRLRYTKHIRFVLAVGRQAVKQYAALGFEMKQIFPWAYFINVAVPQIVSMPQHTRKIIYAGRLEEAKGIYRFAAELVSSGKENYTLDIYGGGPDEEKLKRLTVDNGVADKINFYPFLKYDELVKQYAKYDWVVLPSAGKDGWGVIVSEGLLSGLKAICSNKCGASWAVKDGVNGVVFDWAKEGGCKAAITQLMDSDDFATPAAISKWAQGALSATAGAQYFMQVVACIHNKQEKPGIPWE